MCLSLACRQGPKLRSNARHTAQSPHQPTCRQAKLYLLGRNALYDSLLDLLMYHGTPGRSTLWQSSIAESRPHLEHLQPAGVVAGRPLCLGAIQQGQEAGAWSRAGAAEAGLVIQLRHYKGSSSLACSNVRMLWRLWPASCQKVSMAAMPCDLTRVQLSRSGGPSVTEMLLPALRSVQVGEAHWDWCL